MHSEVVVEVVRSGLVESEHHGIVVALDSGGRRVLDVGDPDGPIFPRSALKPLQATAMVEAGLRLEGELLALAAASHSGEPVHLDGVRRILAGASLPESALQCPADLPLGSAARTAWLRQGGGPAPLAMNCSGKHAAMLATCVSNGWPTDTYLESDHPLQRRIRTVVESMTGQQVAATGIDGCGAPLFATSLEGLARSFAALATAGTHTPAGRVADVIRRHPLMLGGTGRDVTRLIEAVPGLVAKDGAEGVYALALADGAAAALKVSDGAERARPPVVIALLRRLGAPVHGLDDLATPLVLGGGRPTGAIRVTWRITAG